jgi:AcrR family transcriptional regulator
MAKDQPRVQFMQTAMAIVRNEGTEALTLAHLAERAGVTTTIAYEHFGTRAGPLVALFRDDDDKTTEAVRAAQTTIGALARIMVAALGPEQPRAA